MKILTPTLILILFLLLGANAQDDSRDDIDEIKNELSALKPGTSHFVLTGYGYTGLSLNSDEGTFTGGIFNPIFLWRHGNRFLFEGELEMEIDHGELKIELEYANLFYVLSDRATIRFGRMLLPFGTFEEKLHPAWINRLPTKPLGFGHDDPIGPSADLGIEVRGASPLGNTSINYSIYLVNGPQLIESGGNAGMLRYGEFENNNRSFAPGGRIGFFPTNDYSLEIGASAQYARVGSADSDYDNINALMYGTDLSFTRNIPFLKGIIDVKGQWNRVEVDDAAYSVEEVSDDDHNNENDTHSYNSILAINHEDEYTFSNISDAFYAQLSYRPAFIGSSFFRNIEVVGRYSFLNLPDEALWGKKEHQWTFGLNYWINWRTVVKAAYQIETNDSVAEGEKDERRIYFQIALSF